MPNDDKSSLDARISEAERQLQNFKIQAIGANNIQSGYLVKAIRDKENEIARLKNEKSG